MTDLDGRAYLVTGGGSGIGAATAELLARRGANVVVCGRRENPLRGVAEKTGASVVVADCTDESAVTRAVDRVIDRHGSLAGVVASAGTMFSGSVRDTSAADWRDALESNATSAFLLAKAALPHLIPSRGTLVFVASIAALRSSSGSAAYAAAKAAVVSLGQALAVECGPLGVRSNVVCPGWVRTSMADEEMRELDPTDPGAAYRAVTALVPQRRPSEPYEIAEAITWLCSPASSYVNGAVLTVDGGTTALDPGTIGFDFTVTPRVATS